MINLNGNYYRLCLLDTNAVSEMAKNPRREFRHFVEWAFSTPPTFIPCFSLFTVLELRRRPDVYRKFQECFALLPCLVLKSHEQLLQEEIQHYPDSTGINPGLLAFPGEIASPRDRLDNALEAFFQTPWAREQERVWIDGRAEIVEGITSLVSNFPPENGAYSLSEVRSFLEIAGFQQIELRAREFAEAMLKRSEVVRIDAFPSVKMTLFTVFYKFYVDSRRPSLSDAFDIIISAPTPYADAIVTERHQAEVLRKTKMRDEFIRNLIIYTLRDFRESLPQRSGVC